jgi:hypothetical protein
VSSNLLESDDLYCSNPVWVLQGSSDVASDVNGQYFKFSIPEPSYNRGWKVVWTDTKVAINRVLVSGTLSLLRKPAAATSVINLVAYPENSVPKTVRNSAGKEVPVTLCKLAYVSIDGAYRVEKITDLREVVHTDHQPLADWLTRALDTNLINLFSQVKGYSSVWMSPQNCMRHEYAALQNNLVAVKE